MKKIILFAFMFGVAIVTMYSQSKTLPAETSKNLRRISAGCYIDFITYQLKEDKSQVNISDIDLSATFNTYMDTVSKKEPILVSNKDNIMNSYAEIKNKYSSKYSDVVFINKDCSIHTVDFFMNTKALIFGNFIYTSTFNAIHARNYIEKSASYTNNPRNRRNFYQNTRTIADGS